MEALSSALDLSEIEYSELEQHWLFVTEAGRKQPMTEYLMLRSHR